MENKYMKWLFDFIENKILKIAIALYSLMWIISLVASKYFSNNEIKDFLTDRLGKYLVMSDSSLVTVATVFIGIYFTIYTMLTSIQSDSVLANLEKEDFKKILKILSIGFFSSFAYTLYSVFFMISFESNRILTTLIVLFLALLFFVSAFQFGVLLTLILRQDIYGSIKKINERKAEDLAKVNIYVKLEAFLDSEMEKADLEQNNRMSEFVKEKNEYNKN